jgi:hypothetical protein
MREAKFASALALVLVAACHAKESAPAPAASVTVAPPTPPAPPPAPANVTYTTYQNPKYAFAVDVPSFFNSPSSILNDAGQQWTWGKRALMTAAAITAKGKSIQAWFDEAKNEDGHTGGTLTGSSFTGTGKANGKVFWQKTLMQDGWLYSVRLDYDEDLRASFEPVIAHVDSSLKGPVSSGGRDGGASSR